MSEGEFLPVADTYPPAAPSLLSKKASVLLALAFRGPGPEASIPRIIAQASNSARISESGHINRVINMSGRSLKFRIDECDQQTTQINMLIIEALRGMQ